jgi:hypothetical protein
MGAGSSTPMAGVGKFQLTPDQQRQNDVVSNLFQVLLRSNNLLDLSKSVQSEEYCNSLIVTLSSQLEKEFQSLRFPDPANPSRTTVASFVPMERYKVLRTDEARRRICKDISTFLFDFVVLVAALTASIVLTPGIPKLEEGTIDEYDLPNSFKPNKSIIGPILDKLIQSRFASLRYGDVYRFGDRYLIKGNGYIFKDQPMSKVFGIELSYYENSSSNSKSLQLQSSQQGYYAPGQQVPGQQVPGQQPRGYAPPSSYYVPGRSMSAVERTRLEYEKAQQELKIKAAQELAEERRKLQEQLFEERSKTAQAQAAATGYQKLLSQPQRFQALMDGSQPATPSRRSAVGAASQVPITGGKRKRKQRHNGGQLGDIAEFIIVRIYDLNSCLQAQQQQQCIEFKFYMDEEGFCYDKDFVDRSNADEVGRQYAVPFNIKMQEIYRQIPNEEVKLAQRSRSNSAEEQAKQTRLSFDPSAESIEVLKQYNEEFLSTEGIQSPAAQRAYMLAADIPVSTKALTTFFCKDPWNGESLNAIPAYALFGALFKRTNENPNASTFVSQLIAKKVLETSDITDSQLWNVELSDIFDSDMNENMTKVQLRTFCGTTQSIDTQTAADRVQIMIAAHQKLKTLYSTHLQRVVEFVKTILVVDNTFLNALVNPKAADFSQPILRLHPVFMQSPVGSREALNERIRAARQLLADHYTEVETIYRDTLNTLAERMSGTPKSPTTGGRRTRRARRRRVPLKSRRVRR